MIDSEAAVAGTKEASIFSRLTVPMKLGYGVGEVSFNIGYQTMALYLIFYFTDIFGIAAGAAGMIMF
jgi:Na+/melibiose symporter-like transporter